MTGQTVLFTPGDTVPVDIIDDGDGLPEEGDIVEIVGETAQMTEVALVADEGNEGIGIVTDVASDENGDREAGPGTILVGKTVATVNESDGADVSAGDEVQEDAGGGVIDYDDAGTQTTTPYGQVFSANAGKYGYGKGGKVAVALYR